MKESRFKKSVEVAGQILGLVIGDKFQTPVEELLEKDPYLQFRG